MRRIGFVIVLAVVAYLHLLQPSQWSFLAKQIFHSLHGPGFACLVVGFYLLLPNRYVGTSRLAFALASALALGFVTELLQVPGGRRAELNDILANSIGAIAGTGVLMLAVGKLRKDMHPMITSLAALVTAVALVVAFGPTAQSMHAYVAQRVNSPILLSFEHDWEHQYFGQNEHGDPHLIDAPIGWPAPGKTIAAARENGGHGELLFIRPFSNWEDYSTLSFVAASPDPGTHNVMVSLRRMRGSNPRQPTPFFREIAITPEPRRFTFHFDEISESLQDKDFDFRFVESIVISSAVPGSNVGVLLDDFRLE